MTRLLIAMLLLPAVGQGADAPKKGGNPAAAAKANPVPASPESIAAGKRVYQRLCTKCHGPEGRGDGEAATGAQPSDLTAPTLQYGSTDGEMFSVLRHGTSRDMESYAERISESDMWNVINYVKSLRK